LLPGGEILLERAANALEHILSQLLFPVRIEMDKINELLVLAVKMRMRVHEDDLWILRRELTDDEGMNSVGPRETQGRAIASASVKIDDLRVAGEIDRHGKVGQRQTNAVGARALDKFAIGVGVLCFQGPDMERRGRNMEVAVASSERE